MIFIFTGKRHETFVAKPDALAWCQLRMKGSPHLVRVTVVNTGMQIVLDVMLMAPHLYTFLQEHVE